MKVLDTEFDGVKIFEPQVFKDSRGFFLERFNSKKFRELGLPSEFCQDNHSFSAPKVLRGLHFQNDPPQGKLVGVVRGSIWDVIVDVRPQSNTFLKSMSVELDDQSHRMLWIPAGFAHGFCVTSSTSADVVYKVDALYNSKTEMGLMWNDPELGIKWPVDHPILSDRDQKLMSVQDFKKWLKTSK